MNESEERDLRIAVETLRAERDDVRRQLNDEREVARLSHERLRKRIADLEAKLKEARG
jgi:hypothetical protein